MFETYMEAIRLDAIVPNPDQPRNLPSLDDLIAQARQGNAHAMTNWEALRELATSILDVGLQQPITVYPGEKDGTYIIYDGHRRWMATDLLYREGHGDGTVACQVRRPPSSADELLLGQLNTNLQRESFNVFEVARGLQQVHATLGKEGGSVCMVREDGSIEVVALPPNAPDEQIWNTIESKLAIGRSRRYQIQAVLHLPEHIQQLAEKAGLPESRLRFVLPLSDPVAMETIVREMAELKLSNAAIRRRIRELQRDEAGAESLPMPKPSQIRSAIRPMRQVAQSIASLSNVAGAVSAKDPRTVAGYRNLIPEIRLSIAELQEVLRRLAFLE